MNDILIIGRRNCDLPNPERKQLIVKYFQNQAKNYFHLCLLEAALSLAKYLFVFVEEGTKNSCDENKQSMVFGMGKNVEIR